MQTASPTPLPTVFSCKPGEGVCVDLHGERFELRVMQIDDDGAVRLVSEGPLKPRTEYIRRDGQVLELGHARARILAPTREGRRVAVLEVVAGPPATLEKLYRGSKL